MSKSPKSPPRFVPTLTQVVHDPSPPPAPAAAAQAEMPLQLPEGFEAVLVRRLMQRVEVDLDRRVCDAIAKIVQEQLTNVLPQLREEVELVVRQLVHDAVAGEMASKNPTLFQKI